MDSPQQTLLLLACLNYSKLLRIKLRADFFVYYCEMFFALQYLRRLIQESANGHLVCFIRLLLKLHEPLRQRKTAGPQPLLNC